MRLKKLEVYGFKSFADRVEMRFDSGVTGIVGPNGSGKSNISDAVRWVLGEQSAKQLRGSKMEDVIFGGTEKRRRLSYCEVSLAFDNSDHTLPIDFEEVAIARRVYRTGESEYTINRAPCRLKDVVELFRDTGVGRDGYSIIGQGRIDDILSQKSEDRREVFEEAAGIVKYRARKDEAERRLDAAQLNLSRVEDIIHELEERIEPLREQSETAREYLKLRDELKGLEINLFLIKTEKLEARIAELKSQIAELSAELTGSTGRRMELAARRGDLETELQELETSAAVGRDEVQRLIREVESREGSIKVLRERAENSVRERERLEAEILSFGEGSEGVEKRVNELIAQEAARKAESEESDTRLAIIEAELKEKSAELNELERLAEEAKARVISEMNSLGDARSEAARLSAMRDALSRQQEALSGDSQAGAGEREALAGEFEAAMTALDFERGEEISLKEKSAECDLAVREASERSDEISRLMTEKKSRAQEAGARLKLMSELQRDYEGYQNSVRQVLLQARRSNASGVHGVVADLIKVPEKLERAIDMALGAALQNVVVDRDEDAKKLIEYLRANRYGRATFLPIASIRARGVSPYERQSIKLPGCLGVASELVKFDPIYKGVIESLLGRTVIAENLDAGIKIQRASAYALRLVTLEGDVMHSGGSMTGGSVSSRASSLLSRTREIDSLTSELNGFNAELEKLSAEAVEIEKRRSEAKRDRAEIYALLHQQEIAVARAEEHAEKARGELAAHDERAGKVESERQRIAEQLSEIEVSILDIEKRRESATNATTVTQAEIAEMQKDVYARRTAIAAMQKTEAEASAESINRRRDMVSAREAREREIERGRDMEKSRADAERALREIAARMEDDALRIEDDNASLTQLKDALDAARATFEASDASRREAQKAISTISAQTDEERAREANLQDKGHRLELNLSRAESELTQLTDRMLEEYELTYVNALPLRSEGFKFAESERRVGEIRAAIKQMGSVNVAAVDEYRQTSERLESLSAQRDDLNKARDDLQGIIDGLTKMMESQFNREFKTLNEYFQSTFTVLFGGGHAELRLEDPNDALNCGIEIAASPPGKKMQLLSLLSGGERALTAIAILFAMLTLKPTPFCFLDEIEAALDDANIDNFAQYLKNYSDKTQFVVVTHRKGTMEKCDSLYGVAMEEKGVSKMVSVRLGETA